MSDPVVTLGANPLNTYRQPLLLQPDGTVAMTPSVLGWLWKQRAKMLGSRSKYVPHQGTRERARRVACAR